MFYVISRYYKKYIKFNFDTGKESHPVGRRVVSKVPNITSTGHYKSISILYGIQVKYH